MLPNDPQVPDDLQGTLPQAVVLGVREGLRGCNDNGLTSVDAHRVKVLHVTHRDAVVLGRGGSLKRTFALPQP